MGQRKELEIDVISTCCNRLQNHIVAAKSFKKWKLRKAGGLRLYCTNCKRFYISNDIKRFIKPKFDMPSWTLVIPVKDEADIIPQTLPNYLELAPSEVIICLDRTVDQATKEALINTCSGYPTIKYKFIGVKRDPEWGYHQANVRRSGFDVAIHDIILTGDIDLIVNPNCLLAIQKLAEEKDNGVGLVSCSKFYWPSGLLGLYRTFSSRIATLFGATMSNLKGKKSQVGNFTGLYAFSKSRWLETEPREKIMRMVSPKSLRQPKEILSDKASDYRQYYCGEDTFLRDYMLNKYRCVYLGVVGGVSVRPSIQNDQVVQFFVGMYDHTRGRNLLKAIMTTLMYVRPFYFMGYLWNRKRSHKI